jgi:O-antigen/teichoic acid export membrane protein
VIIPPRQQPDTHTSAGADEARAAAHSPARTVADEQADLTTRAAANTLVQLVAPALRVVLGVVLLAMLSRHLGRDGLGQYALIFSYVALFNIVFNDWGLNTIVLREISQRPHERASLIASATAFQTLISCGSYALMVSGLILLRYPNAVTHAAMLYGLTLFVGPINMIALPFQADLRLGALVAPSLAQTLLNFVLSVAALAIGGTLVALAAASLIAIAVQYAWIACLSWRFARPWTGAFAPASRRRWRALTREAWPVGAASTLKVAWQQAPVLILGAYSLSATGLFHAANRIPQQLVLLPLALNATMFPLLARSWNENRGLFARQLDRLVGGSLFVVVPSVVFGVAASGPLLRVLLGTQFSAAATPYALLLVIAGLLFPIIFLAEALNAAGYQRLNLLLLVGLTPPMTALILVLAPRTGATGVAIALLAGYAAYLAALVGAACFRLGRAAPVSALGASMLAAAAGALAVALSSGAGGIVSGIVGATAAAIAFAGVRPDIAGAIVRLVGVRQRLTVHPVVQEAPYGQRIS